MNHFPISIEQENIIIEFNRTGGGFPTRVALKGSEQRPETVIIKNNKSQLTISLEDGRVLQAFIPDDCDIKRYTIENECQRIEFNTLLFVDDKGCVVDKFRLSLRHEFWPDGTAFTTAFFLVEDNNGPSIQRFELSIPLNVDGYDDVHWGYFPRPQAQVDGTFIQTVKTERFIKAGENRTFDGQLLPEVNFNCHRKNAPCTYLEFFMEGQNSISGIPDDNNSSVVWSDSNDDVMLNWNFQNKPCHSKQRPWQWQNQWGWLITEAPTKRRFPPMKMYHYFDNFQRYPDQRQMEKIIASDADILIFHENWRLDPQNGSVPYNSKRLTELIQRAHDKGIRIAVYIRGDELAGKEEFCDWFDHLLKKGKDGLYIDYGGPIHETEMPTERFQGGRIAFRSHYMKYRQYRKRVGENGFILSHTGPFFSALGMANNNVDGYVAGEGEKGILVKGRIEHEYFSEAYVSNGSMWTAAFPEYGTQQMIPFLAATGQAPHNPLGTQIKSSSLSYHGEPGINDTYLQPLWKLWGLFRNEVNISVYNDYNCYNVLQHENKHVGGYLMISQDKNKALLILCNFSDTPQTAHTMVDWNQTGFETDNCSGWLCNPIQSTPGKVLKQSEREGFCCVLEPNGVAGWLMSQDIEWAESRLQQYEKPYPAHDEFDQQYLDKIEYQKQLRDEPQPSDKMYVKISVPALAVPYEDSLFWDLYRNRLELGMWDSDNKFCSIGWIDKKGFSKNKHDDVEYIWPGECSPWIPLHEHLSPGKYRLGVRSFHQDSSFYSFIKVTLAPEVNDISKEAYTLEYMNELESKRDRISWSLDLV